MNVNANSAVDVMVLSSSFSLLREINRDPKNVITSFAMWVVPVLVVTKMLLSFKNLKSSV
jgi:hypothetical protein